MKTKDHKVFSITEEKLREIAAMDQGEEQEAAIMGVMTDPIQSNVSNGKPNVITSSQRPKARPRK